MFTHKKNFRSGPNHARAFSIFVLWWNIIQIFNLSFAPPPPSPWQTPKMQTPDESTNSGKSTNLWKDFGFFLLQSLVPHTRVSVEVNISIYCLAPI